MKTGLTVSDKNVLEISNNYQLETERDSVNNKLIRLGLKENHINEYNEKYQGLSLGRICEEHKNVYKIITESGIVTGKVSGKFNYESYSRLDYPAVGDWVAVEGDETYESKIIRGVLNRNSIFTRKVAGQRLDEQIIATNIDYMFICMSLNNDYNLRKLERYIAIAFNSGAIPVVILTKSDLCDDVDEKVTQAQMSAPGIDIYVTSSYDYSGIDELGRLLAPGSTIGLCGSSGVGKSTLINTLAGEIIQETGGIRNDDRGRHVTTYRHLLQLSNGSVVIDTPGMREIQILDIEDSVDGSFKDIEELSRSCRFSDCKHKNEPGCAVAEAINSGKLEISRYENYKKLKKEAVFMAKKLEQKERGSVKGGKGKQKPSGRGKIKATDYA